MLLENFFGMILGTFLHYKNGRQYEFQKNGNNVKKIKYSHVAYQNAAYFE